MESLLESFDPLHSSNSNNTSRREPLFPAAAATGSTQSSSHHGSNGSAAAMGASSQPSRGVAVSLKDAPLPLDLLSLQGDDDDDNDGNIGSNAAAGMRVNDIARQRQENVLAELQSAEQQTSLPPSSSSSRTQHQASRTRLPPPRRLSRSGLMMAVDPSSSSSSTMDDLPIITHALASPSSLVSGTNSQPSDLFHPSSPPEGSSLESLKHTTNSYFSSLGRSVGSSIISSKVPHLSGQQGSWRPTSQSNGSSSSSGSNAQQHIGPVASTSRIAPPSPLDHYENRNTFPNIDNSDLFARSTSYWKASSGSSRPHPSTTASSSSPFSPGLLQDPSSSSSAGAPNLPKKPTKKSYTFDFPSTSSLLPGPGPGGRNGATIPAPSPAPRPIPIASTSRASSPAPPFTTASSLIIDSEPLPALTLKIPAAASSSNRILTDDIAEGIRPSLSSRLRLCRQWTMLYSLDAHGTSLTTLCARVQAGLQRSAGGCVLCVRDMEGGVFGGYVNEAFVRREGYYGNGECFLWKVDSFPASDSFRVGPLVRPFRWSGSNDYLILSDSPTSLSLGGGNGTFGLWLDGNFDRGFSTTCPTFGNEVLCSSAYERMGTDGRREAKFDIQAVECWAVG